MPKVLYVRLAGRVEYSMGMGYGQGREKTIISLKCKHNPEALDLLISIVYLVRTRVYRYF